MAKRHLLLIGLFTSLFVWRAEAQFTPQGFNYQCIVRDADGATLDNQTVSLLFTIRSGAPNGSIAYSEMQTASTNAYGLVNLLIGQGTPLQGTFNTINWGGGAKYLTVSLETAPNVFDELGTTQLMSVPYALYAQNTASPGDNWGTQSAQTAPTLAGNGTSGAPLTIAQQGAANGQVLKWNGTTWVPQDDQVGPDGTVTEIGTGTGLTGGPITTAGTISLANTPVTPGMYGGAGQIPVITVDQQGRVTDVYTVPPQPSTVGITGAAGISVAQTGVNFTITNTGDTDASDDITTSSTADGDVSGPFSNLQIKANAVGSPEIADNAVGNSEIADNAVNTAELANAAVTAAKLNDMGAVSGQVLKWTGATWAPAADALGSVNLTAGNGISVSGASNNFTINNTGDTDASDDITTASTANGDVSGPFSNLQIKPEVVGAAELATNAVVTSKLNSGAVTGDKIAQMSAANGQVLKWNGTTWAPAADNLGSVTITGGIGIDVIAAGNNYTIANNGDINPFDDITENSIANGDITGPFDNLQIKQSVITSFELANNAVATANIQNAAVNGSKISQMGAFSGQVLKWNGTAWAPAQDDLGGGDNWGVQTAQTGATISGNGAPGSPLNIAQQNATNGQVLKWNGTTWAPAADNVGSGDNWGAQTAQTDPTLKGDGTPGSLLGIAQQGASNGQVLKWDGTAWTPAADNVGGDDWGTQVATTDATIDGDGTALNPLSIAQQGATNGEVLKWNGTAWVPTELAVTNPTIAGSGTAGDPLRLASQSANTGQVLKWNGVLWAPADDNDSGGDNWGSQTANTNLTLSGDGTTLNPLGIAQQGAANGQVLKWNGSAWLPADDNNSGGDNWGAQTAQTDLTLKGNGTPGNLLGIAQQGASNGQVLKWNGSAWLPSDDNTGTGPADNWGTQVAITNATLEGDGTPGNPLGIAPQGATNGQILKWNGTTWAPANETGGDDWGAQVVETSFEFSGNGTAATPLELASQGANFGQVLKWQGTYWGPSDDIFGDNWGVQSVETSNQFTGNGTLAQPLTLAAQGAAAGQVLKWDGTAWVPGNDLSASSNISAGTGINILGTPPNLTIENAGDLSATNELQILSLAGNQLSLSNGGGTVNLPASNNYNAGTGIDITGTAPNFTIVNTGDADNNPTNEIQALSIAGDQLSLSNGGGTVTLPTATPNSYLAGNGINITGTAPTFTIENTGDNDNDATNELQDLKLSGTKLSITGTNSQVNLDTLFGNAGIGLWTAQGNNIYNSNMNGNVGVGLPAPQAKLHVKADGEAVRIQGNGPILGFVDGTGTPDANISFASGFFTMSTSDSSSIILATSGGKTLTVNGITGNIGAGGFNTGNARFKVLHDDSVGGFMLENSSSGGNWEFQVDAATGALLLYNSTLGGLPAGSFATNGVYTPSDRRLKKDINGLRPVLDRMLKLEPVTYRYKQEKEDAKVSVGFIAQDIQQYFPEMVGENRAQDGTRYMALNYAGFSVLAVKAIQEQQSEIETLRTENGQLLDRLNALESRIQQIEKTVRKN